MFFFFLKETKSNIVKNAFLTISTIFIFSIILFIFGLYFFGYRQLSFIIQDIKGGTLIRVFFRTDVEEDVVSDFAETLRKSEYFQNIEIIYKDAALNDFYEKNPHLRIKTGDIGINPLPHSINLELNRDDKNLTKVKEFIVGLEKADIVDEIVYSREWIEKFSRIMVSSKYISLFIGIILLIFSILIIFIITNLNIYFRKEVIEIMKLIGSPYKNIKIPIIIEGMVNGLFAGIISCIILHLLINNIYKNLLELKGIFDSVIVHVDISFYLWIIFFGILCSGIGSMIAIGYYLHKDINV